MFQISKICVEVIDYGFSLYAINHDVYKILIDSVELVQTIGLGSHDIGVLPPKRIVRLYNYSFDKFPTEIYRDTNNYQPVEVDKYLIFENIQELSASSN